ncbi:MAG: 50S ribosomal protein L10, partial [Defluviitaleaceae bacterium]|nr:50S ribosomal protein L10 [Defluviitaleaceae bacterium]
MGFLLYKGGENLPNLTKKQEVINEIRDKAEKAASIILVDGRGLTVFQDTELRKKLRDAGVDYKVYKNTMLHLAFKGTPYEALEDYLAGPTTVAVSYDDATAAARIINGELKTLQNLEFKAGVVDGTVYDAAGVKAIADIPNRSVLISRLLGSFKSPMSAFARVVNEIAKGNGGGVEAAAETKDEA